MKNKKITIKNYQKHAMRTCLPSAFNKRYAYYGFLSEMHELCAKKYGLKAKEIRGDSEEKLAEIKEQIKDEIGDCFWFIALACELFEHKLVEFFDNKIQASNEWTNGFDEIIRICKDLKITPLECMQRNIDKLASRQQRGVLKGNGDSRQGFNFKTNKGNKMRLLKYIWNLINGNRCYACKHCFPDGDKNYCRKYKGREFRTWYDSTCADFKEEEKE